MHILSERFKKCFNVFNIFLCSVFLNSCSNAKNHIVYSNQLTHAAERVGMDDLIQNTNYYKDRVIEITGLYQSRFEESALYANKFFYKDKKKALWVSFDDEYYPLIDSISGVNLLSNYQMLEKINNQKIKIRGKFNPGSQGHLDMFFGSIENVFYVEIMN